MARPEKHNADYFSHDNDMRNDERILAVRRNFHHVGYSIWNMLLEKLCKSENFKTKYDEISIEFLSGDFDISIEELKPIIIYFLKIGLIQEESGYISCRKLIDRFEGLIAKRNRDKSRLSATKIQNPQVIADDNTQSKVKESRVNKSKVKEIKIYSSEETQIVENFIDTDNPQIKYQMSKNENYINSQAAELDKLVKDGYSLETIQTVLMFVRQDTFRSKQILSVRKLREKDKNGVPYIVRMLDEIKKRKPKVLDLDKYSNGN